MNERTIAEAFRKYVRDEFIDNSLFEFSEWVKKNPEAKPVVDSMGAKEFYEEYLP